MTPLRILHVVRSDRFAGVEQFIRRLAVAQAERGHRVRVVGGAESQMRGPLGEAGVGWAPASRRGEVRRAVWRARRDVDVVNAHMTDADVEAVLALCGGGLPALVSTRHFAQRRGNRGPAWVYRMLERRLDAEISISAAVDRAAGTRTVVVHSGIPPRPDVDAGQRRREVLVAQRLQPEKRTDIAVRAFAASGIAADGWRLHIAGEGVETVALRRLADQLGVGASVRFLGFRDDVPVLMRQAALLLAPCPVEGLGLTVIEAMASGLPVVAADAAGHAELLSGSAGRGLFPAGRWEVAAERLRALAADSGARDALGAAERTRQRTMFTLAAQVAGTDAVYRDAMAARRGRRAR